MVASPDRRLPEEALAAAGMMAFDCDLSRGLVQRSGSAAQIMGVGRQQILTAAQFLARIHPDDRARFQAHHRSLRVDSPADTVIFRSIRPDGGERGSNKRHGRSSTRPAALYA
jgi:PAS domain-containing protein